MKEKTVAIFNGYYIPHLGGVERYTYNIAKKLTEKGYRVIIITTQHDENLTNEEIQEGIKIYRLPIKNLWKNRYPFLKKNRIYHSLIEKIETESIDYYVANTRFHIPAILGVKMAKAKGKEAIVIEHGSSYLTLNNPILDFILRKIEQWLIGRVKKDTSLFYGVSNEASEWLKTFNIKAKGVLSNAVAVDEYLNQKIEKDENKITISYAGRLIPQMKGVEILLSTFSKLSKERKNLELIIAGDGPLLKEVQRNYSQDNIKFLGYVPYEKVLEIDAKSDVFVLMSRSEGFATAMLEAAMLENVIVTTSTVGGAKDIMPDETYGYIIENNETELFETLTKVLDNKEQMRSMQKKISKNVLENFTWDQSAKQFIKVFNELDEK
ncbi:Glycosyltransferase [Lactococcus lactis subsp. lactis NCDO 2118]|uniref:Glycosyltransferase n=1 Tax=Lactococcus lactis subsp. lactis NCDO 2118 TaxID=1117941 RepID=A0ABC8A3G9_LACLL|nr:glycosyltransferase family 4 protein [Lactococcus lactis]ADA63991.1 Glycosyltransferase, group 1 [Lactococcus lactis subsp. lactis KF147]AII11706.1 Glycosyltransferase [Lactococcus lactis subsp. lactis NCDO 2118]